MPNGEVPKVGDIFVQADLARTLREIVNAEKQAVRRTGKPAISAMPASLPRVTISTVDQWASGLATTCKRMAA